METLTAWYKWTSIHVLINVIWDSTLLIFQRIILRLSGLFWAVVISLDSSVSRTRRFFFDLLPGFPSLFGKFINLQSQIWLSWYHGSSPKTQNALLPETIFGEFLACCKTAVIWCIVSKILYAAGIFGSVNVSYTCSLYYGLWQALETVNIF